MAKLAMAMLWTVQLWVRVHAGVGSRSIPAQRLYATWRGNQILIWGSSLNNYYFIAF